jgi:DNA-binding beta-propeller fold protein YncE
MTGSSHPNVAGCRSITTTVRALALAFAASIGLAAGAANAQKYEVWAVDQGTGTVHVFDPTLREVDRIDLGAQGVRVPHMIDFTADHAYAFIASPGSGDVTVIRTGDRKVLAVLKTGPRTHMASVNPDGKTAIAAVIGDPKVPRSGKLVEITIDRQGEGFRLGRSLVIADDPVFQRVADRFKDAGAVCQQYTADGRYAYVTLGPALKDGGLVILDTETFKLAAAYPPDDLRVNCGTLRTRDDKHMILNGGDHDAGLWYVLDTATHNIMHQGDSRGLDAHGVWATPDGREIWMVNRVTSNGIVIDPKTFAVVSELKDVGPTPDIIAMSPDSQYAFITLRGPNPVTMPHVAKGTTPGFSVVSIPERKLLRTILPGEGQRQERLPRHRRACRARLRRSGQGTAPPG